MCIFANSEGDRQREKESVLEFTQQVHVSYIYIYGGLDNHTRVQNSSIHIGHNVHTLRERGVVCMCSFMSGDRVSECVSVYVSVL